jgi:hypothetical protein
MTERKKRIEFKQEDPNDPEKYYDHREVASLLGYKTPGYVHDLAMQGKIPHVKFYKGIAGRYDMRFPKEAIDALSGRNASFSSGTSEAKPEGTPEVPEHFQCDKCSAQVHRNDVVSHINMHKYDEVG